MDQNAQVNTFEKITINLVYVTLFLIVVLLSFKTDSTTITLFLLLPFLSIAIVTFGVVSINKGEKTGSGLKVCLALGFVGITVSILLIVALLNLDLSGMR